VSQRRTSKALASRVAIIGAAALVAVAGCGGQKTAFGSPSPIHSTPGAASASPTGAAGSYCPGLQVGHPLLLAWLDPPTARAVVQDLADPSLPVTLCKAPPGNVRFISPTQIVVWDPGDVSTFDLKTAASTSVLAYTHNDGPVLSMDWTVDQRLFAYARSSQDGRSVAFHLVSHESDRIITTIATPNGAGIGTVRVEFAPGADYFAIGAVGSVKTGERASVQVRALDGTLVFGSDGDGQLTWAGEPTKLYFESAKGIHTWDPSNGPKVLPEKIWQFPSRSPDGRWLAYQRAAYPAEVRTIDTRTGVDRLIAYSTGYPEWVTSSRLRFDLLLACPTPPSPPREGGNPCSSKSVVYDVNGGSLSDSNINYVFSTWPRGTPAWS
jgi:hypothetical protein